MLINSLKRIIYILFILAAQVLSQQANFVLNIKTRDYDKNYNPEDEITLIIDYTSLPERGMYFFKPTEEIPEIPYQIWTQGQFNYNRHWYPAYDLPDDKLTSEITASVPKGLIAISNGVLLSVGNNPLKKKTTFHWKMDKPYSNYLTTLIVGDYVNVWENKNGIILEYNIPKEWTDKRKYSYGTTPKMMRFFSNYIASYPYERYAQTTVQDFEWGGMENVTSTTLNKRILHDQRAVPNYSADGLIAHELAHMWFGDYLTCLTWDHIWLNEGFATYFTDLWIEDEFGLDQFRFLRYNENEDYFKAVVEEPLNSIKLRYDEKIPGELSGGKAYDRGAAILNMLRFELGDETFKTGIKLYVERYKNSNVLTEDFKAVIEKASGKNLTQFFRQWVYGAGFPEFEVEYSWNENDKKLLLNVKQVQDLFPAVGLFTTLILVEVSSGKEVIIDTIHVSKKEETFKIDASFKPSLVRFNKYEWILCKVKFDKSFEELVYQLQYDDDVLGRYRAADKLSEFSKKAIPYLNKTLINEKFYGVRMKAAESLKMIGGEEALDPLIIASNDLDARVREAAVKALSIFNADKVGKILLDKLNYETNYYVRGAAAFSIGAVKLEDAFNILQDALKLNSHRNIIRRGIFDGFKELKDPAVLPLVKEYIKYKYSYGGMHLLDTTALNCAMLFSETNYNEVVEVVSSALHNPYFRTRNYAAKLLADLGAKEKLSLLKEIYDKERRIVVKEKLKEAIEKLEEVKKN